MVRWHEEVGVALEDWAETAEALAHAASHWKRNGDVLSGDGLEEREEHALRRGGTDVRIVVVPKEVEPVCGEAQQAEPVFF